MAVAAVCHGVLDFPEVGSPEYNTLYQCCREAGDYLCTTCTGGGRTFTVLSPCKESACSTVLGGVASPAATTAMHVHIESPVRVISVRKPRVIESSSKSE